MNQATLKRSIGILSGVWLIVGAIGVQESIRRPVVDMGTHVVVNFPLLQIPMVVAGIGCLLWKRWAAALLFWSAIVSIGLSPFMSQLLQLRPNILLVYQALFPGIFAWIYSRATVRALFS